MKLPRFLAVVGVSTLMLSAAGFSEEKNGLSLNVQKTTLDRNDMRSGYMYDRLDRTQGLKITVKNESFKDMGEGALDWQILVRKYLSNVVMSYKGTEKVKSLKTGEAQDLKIGAAEVTGWRDGAYTEKDKIEWQVVVKQDGVEKIRSQSTSSFDTLAKRATAAAPVPGH